MKDNTTISIGSVALIEKVDCQYEFFSRVFDGLGGRAKNVIGSTKLFIYNRLNQCFATNHLRSGYSSELFTLLKFKTVPSDRSLYRDLTRIGKNHQFVLGKYQCFITNLRLKRRSLLRSKFVISKMSVTK